MNNVSIFISGLAVLIAFATLLMNAKKNNKGDSVEMGRVLEKQDNIAAGINEIKSDIRETKDEMYAMSIKIATLEAEYQNIKKAVYSKKKDGE